MSDIFADIRAEVLGEGLVIETPYGQRRLTYVDHAASGRGFRPIDRFICEVVMPRYGNTHSETSMVARQTSAFREEAREIIRRACGCGDEDVVIFTGSGATGAAHVLIRCLGLADCDRTKPRTVVMIGSYEHHSNELPWREAHCDVVVIKECAVDGIDLDDLRQQLVEHVGRRLIGSFSAASNVTGRLTNVPAVARVLHDHGALAIFDYAAAGPYVDIRMCGGVAGGVADSYAAGDPLGYADAVLLSMHKFLGGPGAPGVLIAKRHIFGNVVPAVVGGGTVSYVSPHEVRYLENIEHREEGGTPNIPGSIKAGLAMGLKMSASQGYVSGPQTPQPPNFILQHEQDFAKRALEALEFSPNVQVLGDLRAPRLGILSFLVHQRVSTGTSKLLHHNFVVALLNDLFGIQARGGNSCAAPYAHRLLKVGDEAEAALARCVADGHHGCKPGWTRVSFGWYDSDETLNFVAEAVLFIAALGYKFLPDYTFDPRSGTWQHRAGKPPLLTLQSPAVSSPTLPESARPQYFEEATRLADTPRAPVKVELTPYEHLRWFWLPGEL